MQDETKLLQAIQLGHTPVVRALIGRGCSLVGTDYQGYTPLHHSVLTGVVIITRTLLDALGPGSPAIDMRTPFHQTPLFLAALHNHFDVFCLLLDKGADPNAEVMFGQTALHWIVRNGKYRYIKRLIRAGADVNWIDCFGLTPLRTHLQATMNIRITKLLIKNGAEINDTRFHQSSLKMALFRWRQDRMQNFRYLMRHGADINAINIIGDTALHFAARFSAPEVVNFLVLNCGADITARNKFGYRPYDIAFKYGDSATKETIKHLEEMEIERQMQALGI